MDAAVALGEGNTPLLRSASGSAELFFKLENCNPSGSYKDRFVAAEVAHILRTGGKACVATSSGNTGSALAAGCARYGLQCVIFVNQDAPAGKLAQMRAHGATVVAIPGFVSAPAITAAVFTQLQRFAGETGTSLVVSAFCICPEGMRGVQSISHELRRQMDGIDHVFVPVGGGGLFTAVCRGFEEAGGPMPRVHAVQPEGCPTLLRAYRSGAAKAEAVESTTRISGLSVPSDLDASTALDLVRRHGGSVIGVSDDEVYAAQGNLLRKEGIYAEPAGATALAGYRRAVADGTVRASERCVCLVTGHGFKDPASIAAAAERNPVVTMDAAEIGAALPGLVRF